MSATKLKQLKHGDTITLQWKSNGSSFPIIIYDSFPKAIATTFSDKWAALFPSINKIRVGDVSRLQSRTITIVGATLEHHRKILSWMLSCCDGQGLHPFLLPTNKPFSNAYFLRHAAQIIGCSYLDRELARQMTGIADRQIHSEDIRALYLQLPREHEMRTFLAEHVATLLFEKRLHARSAVETLREEIPDFDNDLNVILDAKIEQRRRGSVSGAGKMKLTKHTNFALSQTSLPHEREADPAHDDKNHQDKGFRNGDGNEVRHHPKESVVHKDKKDKMDTEATPPIARRGKQGRSIYRRVDLAQVGVSRESFVAKPHSGLDSSSTYSQD